MNDVLRQAPLFAHLGDDAWQALAGRLVRLDFTRGDLVFDEGDKGDALYVVLDGKVKISRASVDGRENLLAVLGPGELLGELALFDASPRAARATALVDTALARLDREDFEAWVRSRSDVAIELLRVLADRLRQTNEAMADLIFTDVPGRVAKMLLSLADRFGERTDEGVRVAHDLTQEELAQLVGASRETVNKALSDFAGRNWLRLDGKAVVLLDQERLARRAR